MLISYQFRWLWLLFIILYRWMELSLPCPSLGRRGIRQTIARWWCSYLAEPDVTSISVGSAVSTAPKNLSIPLIFPALIEWKCKISQYLVQSRRCTLQNRFKLADQTFSIISFERNLKDWTQLFFIHYGFCKDLQSISALYNKDRYT